MAFVGTDDDENKRPTTSSSSNAQATYSPQGQAAGFVGGSGQGSAGASTAVPATAGGYANLTQYLAANQDTGAATGRAAENVVDQSAQQANQAVGSFGNTANQEIADATKGVGVDQGTLGKISSGAANVDKGVLGQIGAGTYNYSPDAKSLSNLGSASDASLQGIVKGGSDAYRYKGPSDFSNVTYGGPTAEQTAVSYAGPKSISDLSANAQSQQADAIAARESLAGNVKNANGGQNGVYALLRNAYQQPNYTKGETSLDAFLSGGTPGGREALGQASGLGQASDKSYSGLLDQLKGGFASGDTTAQATNDTYAKAIQDAQNTSQNTQDQYVDAYRKANNQTNENVTAAQDAAAKAQAQLDSRAAAAKAAATTTVTPPKKEPLVPVVPDLLKTLVDTGKQVGADVSGAVKKGGADVSDAFKKGVNDVSRFGKDQWNGLTSAPDRALDYVQNQGQLNNLGTTIATAGFNKIDPNAVSGLAHQASNVRSKLPGEQTATALTNKAQNAVKSTVGKGTAAVKKALRFAHGGEVPSYAKLCKMLRR